MKNQQFRCAGFDRPIFDGGKVITPLIPKKIFAKENDYVIPTISIEIY